MKDSFEEFFQALKLDRKNSGFSKKCTLESRFREFIREVNEAEEAIRKNDIEDFREEIGDVLWDLLSMLIIAEDEGLFTTKDVIDNALNKLKQRKKWLFEGKSMSYEEEKEHWKKIKRMEKSGKS